MHVLSYCCNSLHWFWLSFPSSVRLKPRKLECQVSVFFHVIAVIRILLLLFVFWQITKLEKLTFKQKQNQKSTSMETDRIKTLLVNTLSCFSGAQQWYLTYVLQGKKHKSKIEAFTVFHGSTHMHAPQTPLPAKLLYAKWVASIKMEALPPWALLQTNLCAVCLVTDRITFSPLTLPKPHVPADEITQHCKYTRLDPSQISCYKLLYVPSTLSTTCPTAAYTPKNTKKIAWELWGLFMYQTVDLVSVSLGIQILAACRLWPDLLLLSVSFV